MATSKISTSSADNFLYDRLIDLFNEIKLIQSGSAVPATLRRHKIIKDYLIEKQKHILQYVEDTYFVGGDLNHLAIEAHTTFAPPTPSDFQNPSLQNEVDGVNLN